MSRSEHGNARDRENPHDRARKRKIKRLIVSERQHLDTAMPPVSGDAVPCVVIDTHRCVHYPASIDDLRGVMQRLPEGSLNGLAGIELALTGVDFEDEDGELDPFVGRLHYTIAPEVFSPSTLGTYTPGDAQIRLFGYVYDPDHAQREHVELFLRLVMLSTLVHEVGHHQDFMAKETRGRWRAGGDEELEARAEARQAEWMMACVVPYVEDAYAIEVARFQAWLVEMIGTKIPLEVFAARPKFLFSARDAFSRLVEVSRGSATTEDVLAIAFRLHYDNHFELALTVIDHALSRAPGDLEALTDRAHVLGHLGRNAEADEVSRAVLERDPVNLASLFVLRASAVRSGDWPAVIELASRYLAVKVERGALFARVRAAIELTDWTSSERDLGELRAIATTEAQEHDARFLACLWNLKRGRHQAARDLATDEVIESLRDWGYEIGIDKA